MMSSAITIDKALCLPAPDIQALAYGRIVATLSGISLMKGDKFALYPSELMFPNWNIQNYYHSKFWNVAKSVIPTEIGELKIVYWAKSLNCQILDEDSNIEALSNLGVWQLNFLKNFIETRRNVILAFLWVYKLPQPISIQGATLAKVGRFLGISKSIRIEKHLPVLGDALFHYHLENWTCLNPPEHPNLEELEALLSHGNSSYAKAAQELKSNLRILLRWRSESNTFIPCTDKANWIREIAALGERSKKLDEGKSNYQAGTDFEISVRRSLEECIPLLR